jgi:hypothetical protein
MLSVSYHGWGLTWLADDSVYYQGLDPDGELSALSASIAVTAGSRTPPVIGASTSAEALIAHGSLVSSSATLALHHLNALDPTGTLSGSEVASGGDVPPPNAGGVASRAGANEFLVTAADSSGVGRLATVVAGALDNTQTLGTSVTAIAPADLNTLWGVFYIEDGELLQATVDFALSTITTQVTPVDSPGIATSERPLSATGLGDSAALVWVNAAGGVSLAVVDSQGVLGGPVTVSEGPQLHYPQVVALGAHLGVAWLNSYDATLRFKRYSTDLSEAEETIELASEVDDVLFGLAADGLADQPRYAVVYSSGRLKFATVDCD